MKVKLVMLLCLLAAIAPGCAPAKAPKTAEVPSAFQRVRLVGGSLGSNSTTSVVAYTAILNRFYPEIEWSSSAGAASVSALYLDKGTIKLGTVSPAAYIDSYGFSKVAESNLRSINMPRAVTHYFFLIPEDKPWKDISEVPRGLALNPGPPGTSLPPAAEAWLSLAGLSKNDFRWLPSGKTESVDAWRSGKVDILFTSAAGYESFLIDLQTSPRKVKLMGLSPGQIAKAKAEQTFERIGFEPPSKGNLTELAPEVFKEDVFLIFQPTLLSSRVDFPEEIAYRMAKVIDEHHADLVQTYSAMRFGTTPQRHIQWARPPLDIHPGVAKYYREKGYLK